MIVPPLPDFHWHRRGKSGDKRKDTRHGIINVSLPPVTYYPHKGPLSMPYRAPLYRKFDTPPPDIPETAIQEKTKSQEYAFRYAMEGRGYLYSISSKSQNCYMIPLSNRKKCWLFVHHYVLRTFLFISNKNQVLNVACIKPYLYLCL